MIKRWSFVLFAVAALDGCKFPELPPLDEDGAGRDASWSDGASPQYTLTVVADGPGVVSSQPAGISCVANTCTMSYPAGQEVVLTATAESGASFVGFGGACSGSVPTCGVAMSADRTVMASFRALECEANTTTCAQQTLVVCDANGVADARVCPLGCHPGGARCYDLAPTNAGMIQCLDDSVVEADATIPDGATIDTDNGAITLSGGGMLNVPSMPITSPPNGVAVRCFRTNNLTIGNATVIGGSALAIAANGTITVTGNLSVGARAWDVPGPGHFSISPGCNGGDGMATGLTMIGGGGGGGFAKPGGSGGAGGTGSSSAPGGSAGPQNGNSDLVPLRGGCSGGGVGGIRSNAAGAVQLVSREAILVQPNAGISANGWGGGGTLTITTTTRGGGSGGAILLEAPFVALPAQAFIVANGGGGGGKEPGMPGGITTERAPGGPADETGTTRYGSGGPGGAGMSNAGAGMSSAHMGGGGGGSVGRIRVSAYNAFVPDPGSIVSPPPSIAMPARR